MKIYLAGPMRGIPLFNFPLFNSTTAFLRSYGHEVFNPAERDTQKYGDDISASPTGNLDDIKASGFSLREALGADLAYICAEAEAVVLLPGWGKSKGANAEKATAEALGIQIFYAKIDDVGNVALFKSNENL